jgi:hypothetical protein
MRGHTVSLYKSEEAQLSLKWTQSGDSSRASYMLRSEIPHILTYTHTHTHTYIWVLYMTVICMCIYAHAVSTYLLYIRVYVHNIPLCSVLSSELQ